MAVTLLILSAHEQRSVGENSGTLSVAVLRSVVAQDSPSSPANPFVTSP
jgi:hypothetical protein